MYTKSTPSRLPLIVQCWMRPSCQKLASWCKSTQANFTCIMMQVIKQVGTWIIDGFEMISVCCRLFYDGNNRVPFLLCCIVTANVLVCKVSVVEPQRTYPWFVVSTMLDESCGCELNTSNTFEEHMTLTNMCLRAKSLCTISKRLKRTWGWLLLSMSGQDHE
jgi:hypothetical protein